MVRKEFIRRVRKSGVMDIKRLQITDSSYIEGTILFSKRVNRCHGDGFSSVGTRTVPLNSHWLVLRIGGANFLHCWAANSIWLERAESLITNGGLFRALTNFIPVIPVNNTLIRHVRPASSWPCDSLS